ncbi:hypothetical protein BbINS_06471 [Bartonella bacilliformis INS]|uniref:Uncharacterized protein n=2 Tax=Bartonella bacilliformis TaxID=774 RepID=A1UUG1_BARBK|nr:hypothetical protein BARBAKC583_1367 [Bartonella bacilliformis KC583]EKS42928.1 hypothetical protein BbINS_06471 [Bartonella bacilliformis INS]
MIWLRPYELRGKVRWFKGIFMKSEEGMIVKSFRVICWHHEIFFLGGI